MHHFLGVDMSKDDFASAILNAPDKPVLIQDGFANSPDGFAAYKAWLQEKGAMPHNTTICVENAGVYSEAICHDLNEAGYHVCLEAASKVKRAFTQKGHKTDPLDAKKIAEYAFRFHDQLKRFVPKDDIIEQLSAWLILREQLIKQRTALRNNLHVMQIKPNKTSPAMKTCEALIEHLGEQIERIETAMATLVSQSSRIQQLVQILKSVPGVGELTAMNLIVITNAFTDISEYKQFAAYLGICPLQNQSGTSLHKPARSDRYGPPRMRKLLHLGARSTIIHNKIFKAYYLRKTQAGKPKMLVLNNIANKILRICCALVRDNKMFDPEYVSINPNFL